MNNLIHKFTSKPFQCCMELHNKYNCYVSIDFTADSFEHGLFKFYEQNNFLIFYNIFDINWDHKTILEEIYKKLILICGFDPNDKNIIIVYEPSRKIYLPKNKYISIVPGGIFVYDKSKVEVIIS